MFIRNSDRKKLSFPPILIRINNKEVRYGKKSVFFYTRAASTTHKVIFKSSTYNVFHCMS